MPQVPESDNGAFVDGMPAIPKNRFERFAHVDALRAFAILLVGLFHVGVSKAPGDSGVTVFFTISGFIITSLLLREWSRTGRLQLSRFYARRFFKLAPPFAVAIIIPSLLWAASVHRLPLSLMIAQTFFSYNWALIADSSASATVMPGTAVTWSLAVEEQFYIVFAILWIVFVRLKRPILVISVFAIVVVVVASLVRFNFLISAAPHVNTQFNTFARMDAIACGVLLAVGLHLNQRGSLTQFNRLVSDRLLIMAVISYPLVGLPQWNWWEALVRPICYPVIAGIVIAYGAIAPPSQIRRLFDRVCTGSLVTAVGVASYSIYLTHAVLYGLADTLFPPLALATPFVRMVVLLPLAFAIGWVLHRLVEVPVLAWRVRRGL